MADDESSPSVEDYKTELDSKQRGIIKLMIDGSNAGLDPDFHLNKNVGDSHGNEIRPKKFELMEEACTPRNVPGVRLSFRQISARTISKAPAADNNSWGTDVNEQSFFHSLASETATIRARRIKRESQRKCSLPWNAPDVTQDILPKVSCRNCSGLRCSQVAM